MNELSIQKSYRDFKQYFAFIVINEGKNYNNVFFVNLNVTSQSVNLISLAFY